MKRQFLKIELTPAVEMMLAVQMLGQKESDHSPQEKLDKITELLVEKSAKHLELGSRDKGTALLALKFCRTLLPHVEWKLISWKPDRTRIYAAHRMDGKSSFGGEYPIRVEAEALRARKEPTR